MDAAPCPAHRNSELSEGDNYRLPRPSDLVAGGRTCSRDKDTAVRTLNTEKQFLKPNQVKVGRVLDTVLLPAFYG